MDYFWKAILFTLCACVLSMVLDRQNREFSVLLILGAAVILVTVSIRLIDPVVCLIRQLASLSELSGEMLPVLVKALGISLTGQIAQQICLDSGNTALAKITEMLSSFAVFYLSVPLFRSLTDLLREILEEI